MEGLERTAVCSNAITEAQEGVFRCHYAGECSCVCPKGVDAAKALQLLKRPLVLD
jgi:succinate dehydrogenase / fumarate reductase iron-sulfur subunit